MEGLAFLACSGSRFSSTYTYLVTPLGRTGTVKTLIPVVLFFFRSLYFPFRWTGLAGRVSTCFPIFSSGRDRRDQRLDDSLDDFHLSKPDRRTELDNSEMR